MLQAMVLCRVRVFTAYLSVHKSHSVNNNNKLFFVSQLRFRGIVRGNLAHRSVSNQKYYGQCDKMHMSAVRIIYRAVGQTKQCEYIY